MINPLKKYKTLNSAYKVLNFEVSFPNRYQLKEIYVISDTILELRFASIIARKTKYTSDNLNGAGISGVYPGAYPNDCIKEQFETNEIVGYELWNASAKNPKVYLAVWDDKKHNFSYSVYASKGIELKTIAKWQKMFK